MQEDIKKAIKKCSRCALCISNCPIYDIKKDENNTSRGLLCKLSALEKNELTIDEIKKDFKICLGCSKCKENCPAKIDTASIFSYKNAYFSPSKINQKIFLFLKLMPIKLLCVLNIFKKINFKKPKNKNIIYFKGCVAKAQHKITFLDKILYNPDFSCCGLPYLAAGDLKSYNEAKKFNIELIKTATEVIFDCASCKSACLNYSELSEKEKEKLKFLSDFIKEKKYKLKKNSKYKNKTVTFHKPCHMEKDDFENIEKFLKSIKDIKYVQLENYDKCCGFGGSYFVFHPIISTKIALKKALTIKNSKADLIITACPSCTIGIKYNQIISCNFKKTLELRDFINSELEITD